ncbi:hypothetical protein NEF87_003190 [Candidatus Lokiarchaeum ossiferum]|uniref:Uncharacterized protein n=1 Tax=Candidatus Lokiarchaeum ossiferum TaxID=2951803 RepID=A0ABY6HTQ6_9ARCH|nr:hypothetical protein NEF87_003190 [Candidatus Lokiarchaeum sp. B-35]
MNINPGESIDYSQQNILVTPLVLIIPQMDILPF